MRPYVVYVSLILLAAILRLLLKTTKTCFLVYLLPGLGMVWLLWNFTYPPPLFNDFNIAYYPAGRAVWQTPDQLYFPDPQQSVRGFVNLPIVAVLFTPFSYLDRHTAQWIYTALGVVAVFAFLIRIARLCEAEGERRYLIYALAAMNGPLFYSIRLGNTTHFILLLLLEALLLLKERRDFAAGVLLAVAVLIKIPFLLLPLYFGIQRRPRVLSSFLVSTTVLIAISVLAFGLHLHAEWYARCIQPFLAGPLAAFNNQSLDGFLARWFTDGNAIHWRPVEPGFKFAVARYGFMALLFAVFLTAFWKNKNRDVIFEFCAVTSLAILISPISWIHYYLLLLIPIYFFVTGVIPLPKANSIWFWLFISGILLVSAPVRIEMAYFHGEPLLQFGATKLAVSHYFFGGFLLYLILMRASIQANKKYQSSEKLVRQQNV